MIVNATLEDAVDLGLAYRESERDFEVLRKDWPPASVTCSQGVVMRSAGTAGTTYR
jgi:hypothetical protein